MATVRRRGRRRCDTVACARAGALRQGTLCRGSLRPRRGEVERRRVARTDPRLALRPRTAWHAHPGPSRPRARSFPMCARSRGATPTSELAMLTRALGHTGGARVQILRILVRKNACIAGALRRRAAALSVHRIAALEGAEGCRPNPRKRRRPSDLLLHRTGKVLRRLRALVAAL